MTADLPIQREVRLTRLRQKVEVLIHTETGMQWQIDLESQTGLRLGELPVLEIKIEPVASFKALEFQKLPKLSSDLAVMRIVARRHVELQFSAVEYLEVLSVDGVVEQRVPLLIAIS